MLGTKPRRKYPDPEEVAKQVNEEYYAEQLRIKFDKKRKPKGKLKKVSTRGSTGSKEGNWPEQDSIVVHPVTAIEEEVAYKFVKEHTIGEILDHILTLIKTKDPKSVRAALIIWDSLPGIFNGQRNKLVKLTNELKLRIKWNANLWFTDTNGW
jgi:hypothetical protein